MQTPLPYLLFHIRQSKQEERKKYGRFRGNKTSYHTRMNRSSKVCSSITEINKESMKEAKVSGKPADVKG